MIDYVGMKNNAGNLIVVGQEIRNKRKILEVSCLECSKDSELFPHTFKIRSDHFTNGVLPCGCSKNYLRTEHQYLLLANRLAEKELYMVEGFTTTFKNQNSKIKCKCLKDNHVWEVSISNFLRGSGCPKCANSFVDREKINKTCIEFCKTGAYKYLGFIEGYENNKSYLHYECPIHGVSRMRYINIQQGKSCKGCARDALAKSMTFTKNATINKIKSKILDFNNLRFVCIENYIKAAETTIYLECFEHGIFKTNYKNFVTRGSSCPFCADYGYNPSKQGSFYVVKWTKENQSFIKFGITNREVSVRIEEQGSDTYFKPEILFSATFIDGRVPLNIERSIRNNNEFRKGVIPKEEFPDGFTETVESGGLCKLEDFITIELINQEE